MHRLYCTPVEDPSVIQMDLSPPLRQTLFSRCSSSLKDTASQVNQNTVTAENAIITHKFRMRPRKKKRCAKQDSARQPLHSLVMENKIDIARPLRVVFDKVLISRRALILGVARQHALQAYAHALYIVYRTPALAVK